MINFSIELGDGDVAVGVTKLNIREGKVQYGLSFRDLVHPEQIGDSIKEQPTRNFVAITVKNKESYQVLKKAVDKLGLLLEKGMSFEQLEKDFKDIESALKEKIEEEVQENTLDDFDIKPAVFQKEDGLWYSSGCGPFDTEDDALEAHSKEQDAYYKDNAEK